MYMKKQAKQEREKYKRVEPTMEHVLGKRKRKMLSETKEGRQSVWFHTEFQNTTLYFTSKKESKLLEGELDPLYNKK